MIIDSNMTFDEAVKGSSAPDEIIDQMELVLLQYYGTDGLLHQGQMMVNKDIVQDVREVFEIIKLEKFPVHKVVPMSYYSWDDNLSMDDNNSSSFCYRTIAGTDEISIHSFGRAVDINPMFNPIIYTNGKCAPVLGKYDINRPGTLVEESPIVKAMLARGFIWRGRNRNKYDDLHHFDKD